ncbi:sporulenol synthase [Paenibacillus phyllosphaerae]|uniref:Sporulenol synthase n=1 Tax=Paenibacillus phyllosphaerae TaxID=274593 RepID=A0A7W5FMM6_9BACL|nr:prenyltransferase/squalene oxidase repeat-containing protein [Paenibacillus phyllosphaerae]MBB3110410.1 sporulenol synthase [Paenibacillus phyllosphaerae]
MLEQLNQGITQLIDQLVRAQHSDGTWQYRFVESGMMTDCHFIIVLRLLRIENREDEIRQLAARIAGRQLEDGSWRVYPDEQEPNLSATVECFLALQYANRGEQTDSSQMNKAKQLILQLGGLKRVTNVMTKFLLAMTGYRPWPSFFPVPLALLLLPASSPLHFFHFSGYARVHMAPMLVLGERKPHFQTPDIPFLKELAVPAFSLTGESYENEDWSSHLQRGAGSQLHKWAQSLMNAPGQLKKLALQKAEAYMRDRIEADGTLYSYASSTILMLAAFSALGYERDEPIIQKGIEGLAGFLFPDGDGMHLQTTTSTVWDTALISHALTQAGLPGTHDAITKAGRYLLSRQHDRLGDWKLEVENPAPGGWGFSDINTINPDVDDTTAALRALAPLLHKMPDAGEAVDRGLNWLLSMQNEDGGWGAFERNNNHPLIKWIPLQGVEAAATDPSSADLTGRALEYLGQTIGLSNRHPFVRKAVRWLYEDQTADGSWYGRWGVCYIYGTWGAITGLAAVGETLRDPRLRKACDWLLSIQNADGGFGESCESDVVRRYVPLGTSTLVQTAWALDALVSVHQKPTEPIQHATRYLLQHLATGSGQPRYPTGAALPGHVYSCYESYPKIWPLLALSRCRNKFTEIFSTFFEKS